MAENLTSIQAHIQSEKPFVLFRRPENIHDQQHFVEAYLQNSTELHTVKDYTESGFVMAPFDLDTADPILFPAAHSEILNFGFEPPVWTSKNPRVTAPESEEKKHVKLVEKGITAIENKAFKKVVLSRKIDFKSTKNPWEVFERLLYLYPKAYVYYWFHPKIGTWLGATPERLLHVNNRNLKTVSLASTQPVEGDLKPQWTSKEIEEQQYVSDFIMDTLKSTTTHLQMSPTTSIRAGNLWHLKSDIQGRLTDESQLKRSLLGIHPTPAVCGLPKQVAKNFIRENESYNREFYSGFLGVLNRKYKKSRSANRRNIENQSYGTWQKETDLYVNLRCVQFKKDTYRLYVGGGIVKDSDPKKEWEETVNKSMTVLNALD